jgi:hypothetical protein
MRTLFVCLVFAVGCGGGGNTETPKDAAVDTPTAPPDASCFDHFSDPPKYEEIINACTTAQKIFKDSHPPLLNSDGSLPPLPP